MKRFVAGLIAAILLVSCVSFLDGANNGRRTDGLLYKASGIHPDATIMTINGEKISAEEFLYWVAYDCDYLSYYAGSINWNDTVVDNTTYSDYVMDEVTGTMRIYAIVRQMAKQGDITLTDEDMAALDAQRQQSVEYYGGEEGYQQQIQLYGVNEDTYNQFTSKMYYLYTHVQEAFDNGSLRPSDEELQAFAKDNGLVSAKLLFLSTEDMDKDDIQQYRDLAQSYADKLKDAKDVDKLYAEFAEELGLADADGGQTFSADEAGEKLVAAVSELSDGAVSDVIETDSGFYVAIRMPLDLTAVADRMFTQTFDTAVENAEVKYNESVYDKVDVSTFYPNLLQAQQELMASFATSDTNIAD